MTARKTHKLFCERNSVVLFLLNKRTGIEHTLEMTMAKTVHRSERVNCAPQIDTDETSEESLTMIPPVIDNLGRRPG